MDISYHINILYLTYIRGDAVWGEKKSLCERLYLFISLKSVSLKCQAYIYIYILYLGIRGGGGIGIVKRARIHYNNIIVCTITEDRVTSEKFRTPKTRRRDNNIMIKTYTYIAVIYTSILHKCIYRYFTAV